MDKRDLAVKISALVSEGWTFKDFDSVYFGYRVIAEHQNGGTKFFDSDEELVEWLKEQ